MRQSDLRKRQKCHRHRPCRPSRRRRRHAPTKMTKTPTLHNHLLITESKKKNKNNNHSTPNRAVAVRRSRLSRSRRRRGHRRPRPPLRPTTRPRLMQTPHRQHSSQHRQITALLRTNSSSRIPHLKPTLDDRPRASNESHRSFRNALPAAIISDMSHQHRFR